MGEAGGSAIGGQQVILDGLRIGEGVERVLGKARSGRGSVESHGVGDLVDVETVLAQDSDPLFAQPIVGCP